jgi:hypothetical protein
VRVEPEELLALLVAVLEDQVLPSVGGESSRSALLLVTGMLDNLSVRVEEHPQRRDASVQMAMRMLETAPPVVGKLPPADAGSEKSPDRILSAVFQAIRASPSLLTDPEVLRWLATCREGLTRRTAVEMSLMRPTRYLRSQDG